jgi:S-adenosylmethionine synthetase
MGHPDKLADQISDGVLDALIAQDPMSRVACETMVTTGLAVIAGEVTTEAYVDMQKIVRDVIRDVGYTEASMGISADHCSVLVAIHEQSPGTRPTWVKRTSVLSPFLAISKTMSVSCHSLLSLMKLKSLSTTCQATF